MPQSMGLGSVLHTQESNDCEYSSSLPRLVGELASVSRGLSFSWAAIVRSKVHQIRSVTADRGSFDSDPAAFSLPYIVPVWVFRLLVCSSGLKWDCDVQLS